MGFGYGRTTAHNEPAKSRETGARARKVFSNDMVAHVWAARSQTFGQSNNGNFYFKGDSLFSYGKHFLCGFLFAMPKGEPVALLSGESYSVSTSGHMSDARHAVRHLTRYEVPELTKLADALPVLASYKGKGRKLRREGEAWSASYKRNGDYQEAGEAGSYKAARALSDVRKWLASFAVTEDSEVTSKRGDYTWTREGNSAAVSLIASMAGITAGEVRKIQRARVKRLADNAAAERKREEALELRAAKQWAAASGSDFRDMWPADGSRTYEPEPDSPRWRKQSKPYELVKGEELARKLFRMKRAAKAKGWTRIAAKLGEREREYRAHLAGRNARIVQAWRDGLAAEIRNWRNGGARPRNWENSLKHVAPSAFAAMKRQERLELAAQYAAAFAAWQAGEAGRPPLANYGEDSPEHAAIAESVAAERAEAERAFMAWREDSSLPRPNRDTFLSEPKDSPFAEAWSLLYTAEREEAARLAHAKEEEKREAWLAGAAITWRGSDSEGGALCRIRGETLETSHGASVPLAHAIKVFRFVKLCRERGEAWKRNGKTIRVGHFQVDSIDESGNFKAGCHSFNWPEVERVARLAGVFSLEPSAVAVEVTERESA